ncbi:hypothetical protein HanXRQr2_Chr07g0282501 [Helianthus annuus]|uniref:Uncharacterized protein n=1 Tax=Helianthus annuus TaxID=4232 RepID=A0A9K3IIZ8_HELAN|nr:hypothetical protein HanXRQr2_Chr07g0282501 [Helianthus annuus]KAJ0903729.1 hypothetical protein HanPSC8_Chr07g0273311 [Helianthus annuus]
MLFCWQFILKGIDKREILSSGAPQITKEGSGGVNAVEGQSRRSKLVHEFIIRLSLTVSNREWR